ncbi:MAG: hypothetical protein C0602_10440 [Denitrovibrio sp.]|nr:MAG: hypothetical protein C0602_10440 [Denitrovibrio sp.]
MNLIAPNIKNGGGLELLLYLIEYIKKMHSDMKIVVYVDHSLQMLQSSDNIQVIHMDSNLKKIKLFSKRINNALYFGNLPPLVKSKNSMVYFHNPYLLMPNSKLVRTSLKFFVKYFLQQIYIKNFISNIDIVACQNDYIKNKFVDKYSYHNVELLPFFRLCDRKLLGTSSKIYDFCYVSLAHPHKNHSRLIEACEILANESRSFTLALTIEDGHEELIEKLNDVNKKGNANIINLGKLSKDDVCKLYSQSRCLIFPSTEETFGLGLIEAVNMDLDVIASDLEYVYQAVEPSLVFDPTNSLDISLKMKEYLDGDVSKSKIKIENKIDKLINFFEKYNNV